MSDIGKQYAKSNNFCSECGKKIRTMCFQNTGVCCELCRKRRDGEMTHEPESRTAG